MSLRNLGFDVRLLVDEDATLDAIAAAIGELLDATPDDGQVVVQFSGHGTQLPLDAPWSADGTRWCEGWLPIDHESAGAVLEHDLQHWFGSQASRLKITVFADCAHPGGRSRFRPTSLLPPVHAGTRFLAANAATLAAHAQRFHRSPLPLRGLRPGAPMPPDWVHVAACREDQHALEFSDGGAFSCALLRHLPRAFADGWTPARLVDAVRGSIRCAGVQTPQLLPCSGRRGRQPLLGSDHAAPPQGVAAVDALSLRELIRAVEALSPEGRALGHGEV